MKMAMMMSRKARARDKLFRMPARNAMARGTRATTRDFELHASQVNLHSDF